MYYLNTDTIEKAYKEITSIELKDPQPMFYFLIMKACGINRISYMPPAFAENNGLYFASRISSLFAPEEKQPKKLGFLNPFTMKEWPSNPAKEDLKKWIASRLKNNVCGGAMVYRSFIDMDTKDQDNVLIKFKFGYLDWLKKTSLDYKTVNLFALAVWSNRFVEFKEKVTANELIDEFVRSYKIDVDEKNSLFNTSQNFELEFSGNMHDTAHIRSLIGQPANGEWNMSQLSQDNSTNYVISSYEFGVKPTMVRRVSVELLRELLNKYHQIMLAGPPGTSKSYFAERISDDYDEVVHVQFHPQYSYQNFVGGYVVEGTEVIYREGVILQLLNKTYSADKKYLIIIDEFNRANVSQVLGEVIQCLDRGRTVNVTVAGKPVTISLPTNIDIIATLNTTDRTLGTIDYAIKRRFMYVYCAPNPSLLIDTCPSSGFISLCDFLTKLNSKMERATGSRDLTIGHAIFMNDCVKKNGVYNWTFEELCVLYNYKILPMIEDYCSNNRSMVEDVVGNKLSSQLDPEEFELAIKAFMEI